MCGIVGAALRSVHLAAARPIDRAGALRCIVHRGPDAQHEFADDRVWLGHARLSIIDLSDAALQPMSTADGRYVIAYNGEVYNFMELAHRLALNDRRSRSDTEVVLQAFAKLGPASLELFDGMFAFALYDRAAGTLVLARDRLGIKPLYYRMDERGLVFASEIAPLRAAFGETPRCNVSAMHEWLYYGTTLGERTLYVGVHKLPPAHFLELDLTTFEWRIARYWKPGQTSRAPVPAATDEGRAHQVRALLEQAVQRQLVSDVPLGVFLSGGIDSSAITAFASRHYGPSLSTYSVGFDFDRGVNELPKARAVAARYGTDHHELQISGVDIADVVERMIDHHGAPFSDAANIPLYLLSARIAARTKVVLQGDGGDEMFGGYQRYSTLSFYGPARVLARAARFGNALTRRNTGHYRRRRQINALLADEPAGVMARLLTEEDVASHPEDVFAPAFRSSVTASDPFARYRECQHDVMQHDLVNQMLLVDAMIILPDIFLEKVDRSTMAASVEVRVPFLDNDLVDFCMRLTGPQKVKRGRKKWLLKRALSGIVPDEILYGPKTGFGVPYGYWLSGALRPMFFDHLATFEQAHPDILDPAAVRRMYEAHVTGRRERTFLLWKILNFMIWANRTGLELVTT